MSRLISPQKHTLFWKALNYLHSSLPKLFKYVRRWSNRKAFGERECGPTEFPPCGAVGDQTQKQAKNKGLSGLLKTPGPEQPIKIHSNRHEERADCKNLSNTSLRKCVKTRGDAEIWDMKPLLHLTFNFVNLNECRVELLSMNKHLIITLFILRVFVTVRGNTWDFIQFSQSCFCSFRSNSDG